MLPSPLVCLATAPRRQQPLHVAAALSDAADAAPSSCPREPNSFGPAGHRFFEVAPVLTCRRRRRRLLTFRIFGQLQLKHTTSSELSGRREWRPPVDPQLEFEFVMAVGGRGAGRLGPSRANGSVRRTAEKGRVLRLRGP
eukprot:scaffold716_cov364-Pinguiococcus_pyrenoidosus.AAC.11